MCRVSSTIKPVNTVRVPLATQFVLLGYLLRGWDFSMAQETHLGFLKVSKTALLKVDFVGLNNAVHIWSLIQD